MDFVHLHLHTQYSLLDGAIRLSDLFPACVEMGYGAVAMTDHGNLFGAVKFQEEAKKKAIKSIIGCEVYVAPGGRGEKEKGQSPYHLVLLAKDGEGYRNLSKMVSLGYLEGFYGKPRVDRELLKTYSKGLIAMTACLSGEVPTLILKGKLDQARDVIVELRDIFEPDSFYLELQKNGLPDQDRANEELLNFSELLHLPVVATNDCHYLKKEDHDAHEVLLCIQTGKKITDAKRMSFSTDQFYFKSPADVYEQFRGLEHAIENSVRIASRCNVHIRTGQTLLPKFPTPTGETTDSFLRRLAEKGLEERLARIRAKGADPDVEVYRQRLEYELGVISRMGYSDYYLIVWDFIRHARDIGVPVGPGRGSGAGSLVAYTVGITQLDPIQFDLLFERFLNPDRVSLPDFDVDFCRRKRDQVIDYVTKFYGKDRVCQIITYSTLNPKQAIRDVGRVLGFSYGETDRITKLMPEGPQDKDKGIDDLLEEEPRLREIQGENDRYRQLFKVASSLEGLNRQAGVHAAGVVIAKDPLLDTAPLCTGTDKVVVSQFAMEELEKVGLVKFDFLGLKTLTVLDETLDLIRRNGKEVPSLEELSLDHPEVYRLMSSGETVGIFQMESSGFRKLLRQMRPDRFEDVIAILALYRPGPLGSDMDKLYVARKRGEARIEYEHPLLQQPLKDTYGVILYQEQVMRIASLMAGFSMSKADELRKAMGKKKLDKMALLREEFITGGVANGHRPEMLDRLMTMLEQFGKYGFNKSHSAAYAYVSYWTAYLKANYPVEFMAALMTMDRANPEKMVSYLAECRRLKIRVRVPDINQSLMGFSVSGEEILFGLSGIRNVGDAAAEGILDERGSKGPFKSFYEFCLRMAAKKLNKRVAEGLINAGAFDAFGVARPKLLEDLERCMALAQAEQKDRAIGQQSLFGSSAKGKKDPRPQAKAECAKGPSIRGAPCLYLSSKTLEAEREAVGFYLSGHPLDRFLGILPQLTTRTSTDILDASEGGDVVVAGVIRTLEEKREKRSNALMAKVELEDRFGVIEVVVFARQYEKFRELLQGREPLLVSGQVKVERPFRTNRKEQPGRGEAEGQHDEEAQTVVLRAEKVQLFTEQAEKATRCIGLKLEGDEDCSDSLMKLEGIVAQHRGRIPIYVDLTVRGMGRVRVEGKAGVGIQLHEDALHAITEIVGRNGVEFQITH
jgi:DNA polymerase-3 subunit alpha